ncbi:glutamate racemase [Acetobacter sp.]|jgi:glutamate racemase|uniref:glutamate racemase n=1 Tax=Acetobacter sp. TaxID=440 RepID=UPI0025C5132B|nr:glutamate racemase [Acetobacter sp.]MCH4090236.1 glutamate racemase [Acetobacter sp.]MCI1298930.1 glutamate racemase [Acetobacter sp.]MCI1314950.1 glutamate racemase [Acetobacter sp.]
MNVSAFTPDQPATGESVSPSPAKGRILAFDSGIGGLGIVAALRRRLPEASISYIADTALFPYGEQEDAALCAHIVALLKDAIDTAHPDVVVVACNTASTLALGALREACPDTPFVGCVPAIRWAARISQSRVIGLLATKATVRRPYVESLRCQFAPDCTLIAHGARHLADYAEEAFRGKPPAPHLIEQEVAGLFGQPDGDRIDAVALGCTHYTFLHEALRAASPDHVVWLDPADAVARQTVTVLEAMETSPSLHDAEEHLWFTASPVDVIELEAHLRPFGYAHAEQWTTGQSF